MISLLNRISRLVSNEKDVQQLCQFVASIDPGNKTSMGILNNDMQDLLSIARDGKHVAEYIRSVHTRDPNPSANLYYRINVCDEVYQSDVDGGDLVSEQKLIAVFREAGTYLFSLEILDIRHPIIVDSLICNDGLWYRKDGTEITELRGFGYEAYHNESLYVRKEGDTDFYRFYVPTEKLDRAYCIVNMRNRLPATAIDFTAHYTVVVVDTRWGRNRRTILEPGFNVHNDLAVKHLAEDLRAYAFIQSGKTIDIDHMPNCTAGGGISVFLKTESYT